MGILQDRFKRIIVMKVLLITNYKKSTGGISGQVEILQRNLGKEGITADIFSTKGSILYRLFCKRILLKKATSYDVLHVHCCSKVGFFPAIVGVSAGKELGKKVVLTYHGGGAEEFFRKHTRLVRRFLLKTDANIVLSGFLGKVFDKYQIPYTIIPNVIELDASKFKQRDQIKPNFISIRTLSPLYNIECILRAFKRVKQQIPEATLQIVGDGPSRAKLEDMVNSEGIEDVTFVGRVDNTEIYNQLDKADIMLSAPRIDNMPVSILEAFNAGLLVISSNVGGVPYMIEDGVNGMLFESNNNEELAKKMIRAIMNHGISLRIIETAHYSLKQYSWKTIWIQLSELYLQ